MDRKIEKSKWKWSSIAALVLVFGGASFFISALTNDNNGSRLNVDANRIILDTIHQGDFKEYITLFGIVEPIKTVYIDAVEGGRVEEVYLETGVLLSKGQPVIRLSNQDLSLSVLNQEAQIVNQINDIRQTSILMDQQSLNLREQGLDVDFRLDQLKKRHSRNELLYADKVISEVEMEDSKDEFKHLLRRKDLIRSTIKKDSLFQLMQQNQMETTLDLMERNLDFARGSLDNLTVKAPINGQMSSLNWEVGQLINRGDRIAQIDVLDEFKIRANIDQYYINRIFPQQEGTFQIEGHTYHLRINKIFPEVSNGAFTVDMVFVGERPDLIKRGQSISLKLSLSDNQSALLLAKGSYHNSSGGNWVYVLDPNGIVARKRSIKVGRQNPSYYELQEGLQEGEVVIVSGYESFGEKDELIFK